MNSGMLRSALCLALICGGAPFANPAAHAASAMAELVAAAQATEQFDTAMVADVYRETVLKGEGIDRAVARLEAFARQPDLTNSAQACLYLAIAHLQWRDGEIGLALSSSARAQELAPTGDTLLFQARLLDASGDAQQAKDLYRRAAEAMEESGQRWAIRTRLAMMDTSRIDIETLENLALLRDQQFRNQAAVVLALLGRPERATQLYEPRAEDGSLYPQHLRLAEWALKAGEHGLAREQAWMAYSEAEVRLDRRYALALLSESHRTTEELDRLLDDLAIRGVGDEEILRLRVETLIETEEYAQAIELYRQLEGSEADIRQRSRLVSLYEAAGDSDGMVREYERMMQSEPEQVRWYDGLAAHYLHRAHPGRALRVWRTLEERNSERAEVLVGAARLMLRMGFTAESMAMIERHIQAQGPNNGALLFLFEAHLEMGQEKEALDVLARLDEFLPPNAAERRDLADAYERLSRPLEAVRVFEAVRDSGGGLGYDEQMRLAWLYGTVDQKQDALRQWQEIWLGVESPARRFFVEEQMLLLAVELGALGNMALELEAMLSEGTANRHHMSLLVRIYTEAGDQLSATEIIREYAREFGEDEIGHQRLLAQVYSQLEDYSAYDQALRRLHEIDPENREEHIQSILINLLTFDLVTGSNQRFDEINRWIGELRRLDADAATAEFVGNIYSRAGFGEQALESYRRALVNEPENSDILLLMADLLKNHGRTDEAIALLQYFAEHAVADNEFVVAVDGIINMFARTDAFDQSPLEDMALLDWTRRVILERIAANANRSYFYELLADIAREKRETESSFRALENSLADAGIRRPAVLRELLTMSTPSAGFGGFDTGPGDIRRQLQYGRRLVGLRLLWPPEVYIDIGKSLLNQDDLSGAERAFEMIDDITGLMDLDRTKAEILEEEGYENESLKHYNRALSVNRDNLELLHKTGLLNEAQGRNDVAFRRYLEAIQGLLRRLAAKLAEEPAQAEPDPWLAARGLRTEENVSREFLEHYSSLEQGLLLNWPKGAVESALAVGELKALFDDELGNVLESSDGELLALSRYVRLDRVARLVRRAGFFLDDSGIADYADLHLRKHFGHDPDFAKFLREQYGGAGRQVSGSSRRPADSGGPGLDEETPESPLRKQLALAAERDDFHTQLELLRLERATDEIEALLIERIRDGHYREGLAYARAFLGEREFRDLVVSVAPGLIEDRTALLKLLGLDPGMFMQVEEIAGMSLAPDGNVLELLLSQEAWQLTEDLYSDTLGFWEYLMARSSIEDRTRYLQALAGRPGGGRTLDRLAPGELFRDLLREELTLRQRGQIGDMLIDYLSKMDGNDQDVRHFLAGFCLFTDAHEQNLQVLYRVLDYIAVRWSSMPKTRPLLQALYEGRGDDAFPQYVILKDQDPNLTFGFVRNQGLFEGLANARSRLLDAVVSGRPVDPKLARAAYEMEFPPWREHRFTEAELRQRANLLKELRKLDSDGNFYRQQLVNVWLDLGEMQQVGEAVAIEYRAAPEHEAWRLARFLYLISQQRFSEALSLAGDGGADLSDARILQQSLRSQWMNFSAYSTRRLIQHLQNTSGWPPAAVHNIDLPGFGFNEAPAVKRLREALMGTDHAMGRIALRNSWRSLLSRKRDYYEPPPGATPMQIFADSLLSAPLEDPAESANSSSTTRSFFPLIVIPHMPAGQVLLPAHTSDEEPPSPHTLFHEAALSPYGASELDAYLRALPDEDRKSFFRLYENLARAYLASGNSEMLNDLSVRLVEGEMDDHQFTIWMLLHDQTKMGFGVGGLEAFRKRLNEMSDPSSFQLLLAARLLEAAGEMDAAAQYYQLVAARRIQHGEYTSTTRAVIIAVTNPDAFGDLSRLMDEIAERLPEAPAREVIDGVLELARRADYGQDTEPLLHAFALSSLDKVYSPQELLNEARNWSPAVLERPDMPVAAGGPKSVELVRAFARSGDYRQALELIGDILKSPAARVPGSTLWNHSQQESESASAWIALSQLFGIEVYGNELELEVRFAPGMRELMSRKDRILPKSTEDWSNAEEWVGALTEKLLDWLEEGEVEPDDALPLLGAAVLRLNAGEASPATALRAGALMQRVLIAVEAGGQPVGTAGLKALIPMARNTGIPIPLHWTANALGHGGVTWQDRLETLQTYAGTEEEKGCIDLFREAGWDQGLEVPRQLLAMAESVGDDSYARELRTRVALEEAAQRALQPAEAG